MAADLCELRRCTFGIIIIKKELKRVIYLYRKEVGAGGNPLTSSFQQSAMAVLPHLGPPFAYPFCVMARDFAYKFYKSRAWKDCRASFIKWRRSVDGGLCQRCHNEPGYIVHHRIYLDPTNINDLKVSLSFDNLEYVCLSCHSTEHVGRKKLRCSFDENGRPIDVST